MRLRDVAGLAWRSIRAHRLRSGLTTLGVVIGIAAVIAFVTLGASLQAGVIGDVSPDDGRNVYGWAADPDVEGGPLAGAQPVFSQDDVAELDGLASVEAAYGYTPLPSQSVALDEEVVPQGDGVVAAGPSYVREDALAEGRQFEAGEREAVLNPAAAGQFEGNASVGDELAISLVGGETTTAEVVGITDSSEGLSPFEGFEPAPRIYVPTDPYYVEDVGGVDVGAIVPGEDIPGGPAEPAEDARVGDARYPAVVVEAESPGEDDVDAARDAAVDYLESEGADASAFLDEELSLTFRTSTELLAQLEDLLELLQNFVVGIAALSLVVGAIGIANITLVSVTERTREIGIMKAVGARNRDVLALFLTEAVALGTLGAAIGTALGLVVGYLGAWYVDLPVVYPLGYVGLAIVVGVAVGVASGLYPAWRAARTDPIDALRYE